ncbi:MAG: AIPR family protein [Maribacter stanieri]
MSQGFGENDIRLFVESVDGLIFEPDSDLSKSNNLIKKRIPEAIQAIDNGHKVRLRVVRGGDNDKYNQGKDALDKLEYDSIVEKELISGKKLIQIELNLESSPLKYDWNFKVKKNNKNDKPSKIKIKENKIITSLICRVSLKELVDLYHDFQPNPEVIFESNVRGLQSSKKVSNQILNSLKNVALAKQFYKLHNGITIVGDTLKEINAQKYTISNPQIVNGCQTITTISNYFKANRTAKVLEYGSVVCKFFAADKNEVESICLASNSQVAINPWDLRTNDDIQLIIESYLNKNGIKYNRKSVRTSTNNYFTFKELGQWLCSTLLFKPAFAKNSRAKIFDNSDGGKSTYHQLFNSKTNLDDVKKISEFAIYIRDKISSIKKDKRTYHGPANFHFLAGMYYLNNKTKWTKDFTYNKLNRQMGKVVNIMRKKYSEDLTFPQIFTKYDETWTELKKLLDKDILKK